MRRLPIYLLLDVSGATRNERVLALENGLRLMRESLLEDPRSLGIARVGVITFGSVARQVAPLTEIALFAPPNLNADGGGAFLSTF